jgi:ketosteroid isomerase-like protein
VTREVEVVRAIYDAWNAGDFEAARPFIDDEMEFRPSGEFPGFKEVYYGAEGVWQFWQTMMEAWEQMRIEVVDVIEQGSKVVVAVTFDAIGKESGARTSLRYAHHWEVRDGRLVRYSAHPSLDGALGAAGLQQADLA